MVNEKLKLVNCPICKKQVFKDKLEGSLYDSPYFYIIKPHIPNCKPKARK